VLLAFNKSGIFSGGDTISVWLVRAETHWGFESVDGRGTSLGLCVIHERLSKRVVFR
jgi:hypothetical protein